MSTITEIKKHNVYVDDLPMVYRLVISDGKIINTIIYNFNEEKGNDSDEKKKGFVSNCKKIIKVLFNKRPEVFEKVCNILTDVEMKNYCMELKKVAKQTI